MVGCHTTIRQILREIARYLALSPQSRLHQLARLRELDDRLLADIGVTRHEAMCGCRTTNGETTMGETMLKNEENASAALRIRNATEADMQAVQARGAHAGDAEVPVRQRAVQ